MLHDPRLLEKLSRLETESFDGQVFRATWQGRDPLLFSTRGGRWSAVDSAGILYTSLTRDGALAEMSFHLAQMNPLPSKPLAVHTLLLHTENSLRLLRSDLASLGVDDGSYDAVLYDATQRVGAAAAYLGFDGLIAASARWPCDNLMLFQENCEGKSSPSIVQTETVEWQGWARANGFMQ